MPHIYVYGIDTTKQIKEISIHVKVDFAKETFHSNKKDIKLEEIQAQIERILEPYFNNITSEIFSNHEWNTL